MLYVLPMMSNFLQAMHLYLNKSVLVTLVGSRINKKILSKKNDFIFSKDSENIVLLGIYYKLPNFKLSERKRNKDIITTNI